MPRHECHYTRRIRGGKDVASCNADFHRRVWRLSSQMAPRTDWAREWPFRFSNQASRLPSDEVCSMATRTFSLLYFSTFLVYFNNVGGFLNASFYRNKFSVFGIGFTSFYALIFLFFFKQSRRTCVHLSTMMTSTSVSPIFSYNPPYRAFVGKYVSSFTVYNINEYM